jgi:hypothetical protein
MTDMDGVRWDEIQGLTTGDRLTATISGTSPDGKAISEIYYAHHGKRKQGGYVKFIGITDKTDGEVTVKVTETGEISGHVRVIYGKPVSDHTLPQSPFRIEIQRPRSGQRYDEIWSTGKYKGLKGALPKEVTISETNKHDAPIVYIHGLEVEVPHATVGDMLTIEDVYVREEWDRGVITAKDHTGDQHDNKSNQDETDTPTTLNVLTEPLRLTVTRISSSGNALIELDDQLINIGPLDCEPGTEIEVIRVVSQFGICLHQDLWEDDYASRLSEMTGRRFPESLPEPETPPAIPTTDEESTEGHNQSSTERKAQSSADADLQNLKEKAHRDTSENPATTETPAEPTQEYTRSTAVKKYVKRRADGECEGCGEPAPFKNTSGNPYLHAHHVHELSNGGADSPETVIALCPNCHYRVHHGRNGQEYNQELIQALAQIEELSVAEIKNA